jgi:hypothetical protein
MNADGFFGEIFRIKNTPESSGGWKATPHLTANIL